MADHVVYGLSLALDPRMILYVGSSRADRFQDRIREHQAGGVRATRKMAEKSGVSPGDLQARILRRWVGPGKSPEGRVMRLVQALGMGRWNGPYIFSSEESSNGARARNAKHGNPGTQEGAKRGGHIGGRKAMAKMTQEARARGGRLGRLARIAKHNYPGTHEDRARAGRIGGRIAVESGHLESIRSLGGRISGRNSVENGQLAIARDRCNHVRWHINRGVIAPGCALCREGR